MENPWELSLKRVPRAKEQIFKLHEEPFKKGPTRAPTATVSILPQLVMPMAPLDPPRRSEQARQVVLKAPLGPPPVHHSGPAPSITNQSRMQPSPHHQEVVPSAPPMPQYQQGNPPNTESSGGAFGPTTPS